MVAASAEGDHVKTSTAIASASVAGIGLAALAAAPAQAADVTTDCASVTDHNVSATALADNWYMDCVPQYGLGKVEFTVDSSIDFPPGFAPLSDPSVGSSSANTGPAATTYFGSTSTIAGFTALEQTSASPRERTYEGRMMFAISGVSTIDVSALPAACGAGPYSYAYRVDYLPATVTFTQTIGGVVWTTVVQYTPSPLYLGLNFIDPPNLNLDPTAALCASSTTGTTTDWFIVATVHATAFDDVDGWQGSITPFPMADSDPVGQLGTFSATVPKPALADTGTDPAGLGLAGGLSILTGFLLTVLWRRRRNRGPA